MNRLSIRAALSVTTFFIAAVVLGGCTGTMSSDESGTAPAVGAPDIALDGGGLASIPGETSRDLDARQVISTGTMTITADDPIAAAAAAVEIVEDAGGRIDSRSEQPATDSTSSAEGSYDSTIYPGPGLPAPSASLIVRIPAEKLTGTLEDVKKLGEVESVSIDVTDVTAASEDLDARITALRASVDRLVSLLAGASSTTDLITIETALSSRQAELESLESQQRSLTDQVDLSTVSIYFGSVASAPVDRPSDFFSGIGAGWQTLVAFLGGVLVALGFLLPWLLVIAVVGVISFALLRRQKRRRRAAFFAAVPPASGPPAETSSEPSEQPSATMEK